MRAILDTNVVISALISRKGAPAQVLVAARLGHFEALVSPLLLDEIRVMLAHPKFRSLFSRDEAQATIHWLTQAATQVNDSEHDPPVRCAGPDDDFLVALAAEQQAALVSGDKYLLDLRDRIPVYSPREFLELIG